MTITEQLNANYAEGRFAVVLTNTHVIPIRDRNMIREAKGGIEFQNGRKWIYAFAYQVKFAHNA